MIISQSDWSGYRDKQKSIREKAASLMQAWIDKNGLTDRYAMTQYAAALIDKYGEAAGALACDMYDELAVAQGVTLPAAVPAPLYGFGEVAKAINGSLLQSETGLKVPQVVERITKQAGADTMLKNAKRDRAEWAWVPSGDTCAFCITLASRGWQHASKAAMKGGHAEHIHANCDCEYVIRFDGKSSVKGYNPDEYKRMYYGAEGNTSRERINSLRMELEQSRKHRVYEHENSIVDMDYIKSNEFSKKLLSITDSFDERRGIHKSIIEALEHRSGTYFEDLSYVDSKNGKYIINKEYDFYDEEKRISACKPNHSMNALIRDAQEHEIIGVHNHPFSGAPSTDDIRRAYERKYKYGVVQCHNGTIYKYTVDDSFENTDKNASILELYLADLQRGVYNKDAKRTQMALDSLSNIGVHIKVVE